MCSGELKKKVQYTLLVIPLQPLHVLHVGARQFAFQNIGPFCFTLEFCELETQEI